MFHFILLNLLIAVFVEALNVHQTARLGPHLSLHTKSHRWRALASASSELNMAQVS
jgi:hypothetical protein